ncbi:hypothetical protein AB0M12_42335 [Nocardia vinacea]|uniref:hypothetical protein n=1 Tax=Nocardia vinacea TaxID=96468 RepID=UPI00342CE126
MAELTASEKQMVQTLVDGWLVELGVDDDTGPASSDQASEWKNAISQVMHALSSGARQLSRIPRWQLDVVKLDSRTRAYAYDILADLQDQLTILYRDLNRQEQREEIKAVVEARVSDPLARQEIEDAIATAQEQEEEAQRRADEAADAKQLRALELQERRWDMRKRLLDREPAAVLVGAVLLGVLSLALIIAMFTNTAVPEILSSAFLLILGFFFGQTTSGKGKSGGTS